jgi:hypothetical protein
MVEFATLNARLTEAAKKRLGELVTFTPKNGVAKPNTWAVIDRNVEIVGQGGQVSDLRVAASLALADVGEDVAGARIKTASGEEFDVDSKLDNDGLVVRVALR